MDIAIADIEDKWKKRWKDMNLYRFTLDSRTTYTIDVPPPTISGDLHMGHAFSYPHQDFVARYKRLKGFNVCYQFGYDDNGLPTERYTEKATQKKAKNIPLTEFLALCREKSNEAEHMMSETFERLGISSDFSRYYRTSSDETKKISQSSFIELARTGRAYNAVGPTIRCPNCGTAISQIELRDRKFKTDFVFIKFGSAPDQLIIATTRPEMLGSCVAVFVNSEDRRYSHLVGKNVRIPVYNSMVPVMADDYVSMDMGTGAEMVCTFGDQNDMYLWKKHSLPTKMILTPDGKIDDSGGPLSGLTIDRARKEIISKLQDGGYIDRIEKTEHSVNVHERCDTPIEIGIERQWFVKVLDLIPQLIEYGERIKWFPEHMKVRYDNWVNGLKWDWCISRQRYYGVPFPVWHCNDCGAMTYAGEDELPVDPRLEPPRKCNECGSSDTRPDTDVMDTWATSSLSPRIALSMNSILDTNYPMDIRFQGHDIISTWAFTTITRSMLHDESIPWRSIMLSGIVSDPTGAKMSKSRGNVTNPVEVLETYGADATRFWSCSSLAWDDIKFKEQELVRGRKTVIKLHNAARLLRMLAEDAGIAEVEFRPEGSYARWILRKLASLEKNADSLMNNFLFSKARTEIDTFFWNIFCDYYLEIAKFASKSGDSNSGSVVMAGLYTLLQVIKMYSPIIPFATEEIYSGIPMAGKKESIHRESWPLDSGAEQFSESEEEIDYVVRAISSIRSEKAKGGKDRRDTFTISLWGESRVLSEHSRLIESLSGSTIADILQSSQFRLEEVND